MGDQGHFQGSPYNTPHQQRQRLSSSGSIGSHHSFHGEASPQQYYNMQPMTSDHQMPLQNELHNLQLSHSQQSLNRSDSSFEISGNFDNMPDFAYTTPLTGDPNVLWNQQNDPSLQTNYYSTDYGVNQPHIPQMNQNYQQPAYCDDSDDRFESTLTHANANNAQAVTTHPQQAQMVYSNPPSQEPNFGYYQQPLLSNMSTDFSVDGIDYSNQDAGWESDTSQRSIRHERTSRAANRPYDRPASRSTSRNSNLSESSSNPVQPAGRGRPAVYKIDFNNLTESQKKTKKKIEDNEAYRKMATEEEKYSYLVERLQNNEAVRHSRLNKNRTLNDVLDFGEKLYHAARHAQHKVHGFETEIESLMEKIERWEIDNNTFFVQKVKDLQGQGKEEKEGKRKPKPNAGNDP